MIQCEGEHVHALFSCRVEGDTVLSSERDVWRSFMHRGPGMIPRQLFVPRPRLHIDLSRLSLSVRDDTHHPTCSFMVPVLTEALRRHRNDEILVSWQRQEKKNQGLGKKNLNPTTLQKRAQTGTGRTASKIHAQDTP